MPINTSKIMAAILTIAFVALCIATPQNAVAQRREPTLRRAPFAASAFPTLATSGRCVSAKRAILMGGGWLLGTAGGMVYGARRGNRGETFDTGGAIVYGVAGGVIGALAGWATYRLTGGGCDYRASDSAAILVRRRPTASVAARAARPALADSRR